MNIMKQKWILTIIVVEFFALIYVLHLLDWLDLKIFMSGVSKVIIGVTVGVITAILVFYLLFKKQKTEDMKIERRKELEEYLRAHSKDLVNGVLSKWFELRKNLHALQQHQHVVAGTPLAKVIYEPPKSRIINSIEIYNLKSDIWHQAVSHLRAEEYTIEDIQFMDSWLECETLSDSHLNKNLKVLESIEKKVLLTSIPKKFAKWDGKGTSPPTCYILDNTVYAIYQEAKQFMNHGKFYDLFKITSEPEQGYKVASNELYAKSPTESLANEFRKIVYEIAQDKPLIEQLKLLDVEEKNIQEQVREFKEELDEIIYDFEKRYYILKCTCDCCKQWVDELKSLDESYYKKLISPD